MAKSKMKYNIVNDGKTGNFINAGKLKYLLKNVPDEAFICFNDCERKFDRDIFGNVTIKGFIKQKYSLSEKREITKIVLTPFGVNGDNNDKE